jgi:hypothetical protein
MQCSLCRAELEPSAAVTVIISNELIQNFCGQPAGKELSCWQEAVRGWYWALMAPVMSLHDDERDQQDLKHQQPERNGERSGGGIVSRMTRGSRIALVRGQLVVR